MEEKKPEATGKAGATSKNVRRAENQHRTGSDFPIVGIGSSAGGLAPIQRLLEALDPHLGMAYVVVCHLKSGKSAHKSYDLARVSEVII